MLMRKFSKCSAAVKLKSLYLNHIVLRCMIRLCGATTLAELLTVYRRVKILFGYSKLFSLTQMLLELRLPSFATVLLNGTTVFRRMWSSCFNSVVQFYSVCHCSF